MTKLLICGTAKCLWDDLQAVGSWRGDVMACNMAGVFLPMRIKHWASCHHDYFGPAVPMAKWFRRDIQADRPQTHAPEPGECVDVAWGSVRPHDYTGYFATRIGVELGYDRIILAGVPMDGSGHFYDRYDNGGDPYNFPMNDVWQALPAAKIASMSGKTRALFGPPSAHEIGHRMGGVTGVEYHVSRAA